MSSSICTICRTKLSDSNERECQRAKVNPLCWFHLTKEFISQGESKALAVSKTLSAYDSDYPVWFESIEEAA